MIVAVISDVHANVEALDATFIDFSRLDVDDVFFLGDVLGYGPSPNECITTLTHLCQKRIAGNHDHAAIGMVDTALFNPVARAAIDWTADVLDDIWIEEIAALPLSIVVEDVVEGGILLVHGTPFQPEAWHYMRGPADAAPMFNFFDQRICMVGHSHVPFAVELTASGEMIGRALGRGRIEFSPGSRYIVNVGSIGQPRDGDPRSSYVVLDDGGMQLRRVPYDIRRTQEKMAGANLPRYLIDRLAKGL